MANRLSKSRFQTGLQCPKALWLSTHAHDLADPTSENQQHIFDTGTSVGELARERFADGVLVAEDYMQSAQALETTRRLLEDPPSAIFEAALEHGGVFVRPDVLVRVGDNLWDLYEVKSTTRVKAPHITDIAVQTWVLEGAGLPIRRAYLMHLDNTYVYPGGEYDLTKLSRRSPRWSPRCSTCSTSPSRPRSRSASTAPARTPAPTTVRATPSCPRTPSPRSPRSARRCWIH